MWLIFFLVFFLLVGLTDANAAETVTGFVSEPVAGPLAAAAVFLAALLAALLVGLYPFAIRHYLRRQAKKHWLEEAKAVPKEYCYKISREYCPDIHPPTFFSVSWWDGKNWNEIQNTKTLSEAHAILLVRVIHDRESGLLEYYYRGDGSPIGDAPSLQPKG